MNRLIEDQRVAKRRAPLLISQARRPGLAPFLERDPQRVARRKRAAKAGGPPPFVAIGAALKAAFARKAAPKEPIGLLAKASRLRRELPGSTEPSRRANIGEGLRSFGGAAGATMALALARLRSSGPGRISLLCAAFLAALALLVVLGAMLSPPAIPREALDIPMPADQGISDSLMTFISPELGENLGDASAQELGDAPELPLTLSVHNYTIVAGDSLSGIAGRFGLSMDSIISMNGIKNAKRLQVGTALTIPNMSGIVHIVARGDTISSIAKRYKIGIAALVDTNDLESQTLRIGQSLFIPGGALSPTALKSALGELMKWPLGGRLSSPFGWRISPITQVRMFHYGIDIANTLGTTVKAAMDGTVLETGYNRTYGNYVILSHPEGYQTWYAHLESIAAKPGQRVDQGQAVGLLGSTGLSTGPHLHFSVFRWGKALDPLKVLKF